MLRYIKIFLASDGEPELVWNSKVFNCSTFVLQQRIEQRGWREKMFIRKINFLAWKTWRTFALYSSAYLSWISHFLAGFIWRAFQSFVDANCGMNLEVDINLYCKNGNLSEILLDPEKRHILYTNNYYAMWSELLRSKCMSIYLQIDNKIDIQCHSFISSLFQFSFRYLWESIIPSNFKLRKTNAAISFAFLQTLSSINFHRNDDT